MFSRFHVFLTLLLLLHTPVTDAVISEPDNRVWRQIVLGASVVSAEDRQIVAGRAADQYSDRSRSKAKRVGVMKSRFRATWSTGRR